MVFWQLTIDANDPARLARFWAGALGWTGTPPAGDETWWALYRARLGDDVAFDDRLFDPDGRRPPIWFQGVPEHKAGKNRLHLDLYPTGRDQRLSMREREEIVDATVTELVAAGATVQYAMRDDNDPDDLQYSVTLHDPEGNEFCVA